MLRRAVWALAALGIVGLSAGSARAECTKDTDCKGDRVCDAGKCTWPKGSAPPAAAAAPAPPAAAPPAAPTAAPPAAPAPGAPAPAAPPPAAPAVAPPAGHYTPPPGYMAVPITPPPRAPADQPVLMRRNKPMMIAGIVMVTTGPIALLAAMAARNAQQTCDDALTRLYPNHVLPTSERYRLDQCDSYNVPIYLFGIGGAVLTGVGLPLLIYGGKSIKKPQTALEVRPWATPASGGLQLRLTL